MIITRTPFRISFVGGGTDLPDFYRLEPGAVVSTAINKYMYVIVNKRFTDAIRVSYYSKTEIVDSVDEIRHPLVREVLKLVGITRGIEIASIADVHAGAGLGSSSSFTVGLLNALYAYKGILKSAEELAKEACHIEIDILGEPIGKQDQYIAAYGGFRYIQFNSDETVLTEPIIWSKANKEELAQNLLVLYTGDVREASSILREQKENTRQGNKVDLLKKLRDMAFELKGLLNNNASPDILGEFLHKGWMLKKQLASSISNNKIDEYYEKARSAGVLGGKILGAGGGGFLLLYCPKEKQPQVKEALNHRELDFSFEPEGSKIIYVV
ncbi:MAG: D-glycero-alpha-D-manno-heptose 7-phosphate kinase [Firmicutes bacterium]|nr:D-glycero-alpha-D-manno-heptose 7-phosphate kinase [Bacillota bacterium]